MRSILPWLAAFSITALFSFNSSLSAQERSASHPLINKISDSNGKLVDLSLLLNGVRTRSYVFIGEKHDNPEHHRIELALINARFVAEHPKNPSTVVFEMLDDTQDPVLSKLKPTDTLDEMFATLSWPVKGWDWSSYGPLFQSALKVNALKSGNIGRGFIGEVYRDGDKKFVDQERFSTALQASPSIKSYLLDQIFTAHCGMQSRETLAPMLSIQLAKDASMASAMLATSSSLLIAGGEHVRPETATPWHLRQKKTNADTLIVQLIEVKETQLEANSYFSAAGKADFYWFTSATPTKDYCADVKGRAAK
jgi:uncharacterized iron-regulated protein